LSKAQDTRRKIPKNYRNITGKSGTNKSMHEIIGFESKLERDFYFLFNYLDDVVEMSDQPITIKYEYRGKEYSYTPDFFIELANGQRILGEIKYHSELQKNFQDYAPKFRAAIEFCKTVTHAKFKIFTDRCPYMRNEDFMWNIRFLSEYKIINQEHYQTILSNFKRFNTVGELLERISSDKYEQASIVPTLWALTRSNIIRSDLNVRLSMKTVLEDMDEY
jgi:hypothetical protein